MDNHQQARKSERYRMLKIKRDREGKIEKYKARLVAQGFTQIYGVNYTDTFAPVAKFASIRTILSIAATNDWPIEVFDFNIAFLNGKLDSSDVIYMQQPPGYGNGDRNTVLKLHKAIYGLKQGGKTWYDTLSKTLFDLGFKCAEADPGVFYLKQDNNMVVYAIHVDDCVTTGSTQGLIDHYKRMVSTRFALTDLGPIHYLLGIGVTRDRKARTISLSQTAYIDSLLERFGLSDAKPLAVPADPNIELSKEHCAKTPEDVARMARIPYREAIGALISLRIQGQYTGKWPNGCYAIFQAPKTGS